MLMEIVLGTPVWVFAQFFVLLGLGYSQSRDRVARRPRIFLLPAALPVLSIYGAASAFGMNDAVVAAWLAGAGLAGAAGWFAARPRGVAYLRETRSFSIPGSWVPLVLMMGIFFTRYAVGAILARQFPIANAPGFAAGASLFYGVFSGLFLSRALAIRRSIRTRRGPATGA